MRRFLILIVLAVFLLLPSMLFAQAPTSTSAREPVWPGLLPPVAGRMFDDLAHQRWMIDPATGDLAFRNIDPFLDVEVRATRQPFFDMKCFDNGSCRSVAGVRWMDVLGRWHSEVWPEDSPVPWVFWARR